MVSTLRAWRTFNYERIINVADKAEAARGCSRQGGRCAKYWLDAPDDRARVRPLVRAVPLLLPAAGSWRGALGAGCARSSWAPLTWGCVGHTVLQTKARGVSPVHRAPRAPWLTSAVCLPPFTNLSGGGAVKGSSLQPTVQGSRKPSPPTEPSTPHSKHSALMGTKESEGARNAQPPAPTPAVSRLPLKQRRRICFEWAAAPMGRPPRGAIRPHLPAPRPPRSEGPGPILLAQRRQSV